MPIGFPAYHKETFSSPIPEADLVFCSIRTLEAIGWPITQVTPNKVRGTAPWTLWSFGEEIEFHFSSPNECQITSKCIMVTQMIDWGKNRRNIEKILPELNRHVATYTNPMAVPPPPINPR